MDFIEQWFGVSPDGGDGSVEADLMVAVLVVIAAMIFRRQVARFLADWRRGRERNVG